LKRVAAPEYQISETATFYLEYLDNENKESEMAGQIKKMIDKIIIKKSGGNPSLVYSTKIKLLMKGIDPNAYNKNSEDDPLVLEKMKQFARELEVEI